VANQAVSIGSATVTFDVPSGTFLGSGSNISLYARFRLYTSEPGLPDLAYNGTVANGEVEDYRWTFSPTAVTLTSFTTRSVIMLTWLYVFAGMAMAGLAFGTVIWRKRG